jgi:hypothetical protein
MRSAHVDVMDILNIILKCCLNLCLRFILVALSTILGSMTKKTASSLVFIIVAENQVFYQTIP